MDSFTENVQSVWRHKFYKNRNFDAITKMNSDEPLDFSLKKRPRTEQELILPKNEPMDWTPKAEGAPKAEKAPRTENQLLRSCLEGRSAFESVPARSSPVAPHGISFSPFLSNLLRGTPSLPEDAAKTVRPFKAYNPTDPSSALSVANHYLGLTMLPRSAELPTPSLKDNLSLSAHYRNILPRSHSVPSQNGPINPITPPAPHPTLTPANPVPIASEVSSTSTGAQAEAVDLSPGSTTGTGTEENCRRNVIVAKRDNSNSPTSTSDMAKTLNTSKRAISPVSSRSESGSSSDGSAPFSSGTRRQSVESEMANFPSPLGTSRARRRGQSMPEELKDNAYWERRRKNNEAAKRSRDTRRAKEDEIAMRAVYLEQENLRLRMEVAALQAETDKLRHLLINGGGKT